MSMPVVRNALSPKWSDYVSSWMLNPADFTLSHITVSKFFWRRTDQQHNCLFVWISSNFTETTTTATGVFTEHHLFSSSFNHGHHEQRSSTWILNLAHVTTTLVDLPETPVVPRTLVADLSAIINTTQLQSCQLTLTMLYKILNTHSRCTTAKQHTTQS